MPPVKAVLPSTTRILRWSRNGCNSRWGKSGLKSRTSIPRSRISFQKSRCVVIEPNASARTRTFGGSLRHALGRRVGRHSLSLFRSLMRKQLISVAKAEPGPPRSWCASILDGPDWLLVPEAHGSGYAAVGGEIEDTGAGAGGVSVLSSCGPAREHGAVREPHLAGTAEADARHEDLQGLKVGEQVFQARGGAVSVAKDDPRRRAGLEQLAAGSRVGLAPGAQERVHALDDFRRCLLGHDLREKGELIAPALHEVVSDLRTREIVPQPQERPLLRLLERDRDERRNPAGHDVGEDDPAGRVDFADLAARGNSVGIANEDRASRPRVDPRTLAPPPGEALGVGEIGKDGLAPRADQDLTLQGFGQLGHVSVLSQRRRRRPVFSSDSA